MRSHRFGNRPDCAYFLLLGLAVAAFFVAMGGVCSYVAYWPDALLSHQNHHRGILPTTDTIHESPEEGENIRERAALGVVGPLCLAVGFLILVIVSVTACKYKCDHEPEEPNIAFLRLASEMSLNFDPERNKYELMMDPKPSSLKTEPGSSQN